MRTGASEHALSLSLSLCWLRAFLMLLLVLRRPSIVIITHDLLHIRD